MLLSLSWLREFTPYEGEAQSLGDRLTMLGLELEEIHHPFAHLRSITTGHVVTCAAHPDSDHLHVTTVDVGGESLLSIVCGAPNVAAGQKVAVATVGTRLPDGTVIKKSKLRGQPSFGMICSERELGLSEDHDGIMVLPAETPVGRSLHDVLPLDDEILDIAITPNRGDCLSVLGLARETALVFGLPLTIPPVSCDFSGPEAVVAIDIQEKDDCPLYTGRVVSGLTVQRSPARVRYRLRAVGIRAISNIVDVTNYILMECGQPLHAFDLDALSSQAICVRRARRDESIVTLDGQERLLTERDLCICDERGPVALAGVMGGLSSEITEKTERVFVESAVFNPAIIRKTSRRLGLSSESSYRFERGIDSARTAWSLDRACAMLSELSGGTVHKTLNIKEAKPFVPVHIPFRPEEASALLGVTLEADFCRSVLTGIGCAVTDGETWDVVQPSWRSDITRTADLIEEVGRVHGLDAIEPAMPPVFVSLDRKDEPASDFTFWSTVRHWAAGLGLNEVINYSFVGEADLDRLHLPKENRIAIKNPLTSDQNVLRPCLAPGLLSAMKNNLAQGAQRVALFELARVFTRDEASPTEAHEEGRLGIILTGLRHADRWPYTPEDMGYADIRGFVEHLALTHKLESVTCVRTEHPYLMPAVAVSIGDERLGTMGRLLPAIADSYLASKDVWTLEISLAKLKDLAEKTHCAFRALPLYPPVRRDITVIGPKSLSVGQVMEHIRGLNNPLVCDVQFVSLFEPEGSSEKHLSFRLTFRHQKRTLKDGEVDKERTKIAQSLVSALGVRL
ncbi:MAG: phenylalanine--tRNA ligase subunit beta [Desulfovibrionaceae bacterium]|nr:phenylalanine--tRNA ligase subunit beta [Desulfovibrionaceae bacterium]